MCNKLRWVCWTSKSYKVWPKWYMWQFWIWSHLKLELSMSFRSTNRPQDMAKSGYNSPIDLFWPRWFRRPSRSPTAWDTLGRAPWHDRSPKEISNPHPEMTHHQIRDLNFRPLPFRQMACTAPKSHWAIIYFVQSQTGWKLCWILNIRSGQSFMLYTSLLFNKNRPALRRNLLEGNTLLDWQ